MKSLAHMITIVFIIVLVGITAPLILYLAPGQLDSADLKAVYSHILYWVIIGIFAIGETGLLTLRIYGGSKNLAARRKLATGIITVSFFLAALFGLIPASISLAIWGTAPRVWWGLGTAIALIIGLWAWWSYAFMLMVSESQPARLTRASASRLTALSLLELAAAIPCSLFTSHSDSPLIAWSLFGCIAFGIAVFLMAIGPLQLTRKKS